MTFDEYKKFAAKPTESIKGSLFFIQEYYVKNITELLENKHCKCERVSCGFTQKFSKAKALIRRKYTNSKYLFNNLDAISFFTISECNFDRFISPYTWSKDAIQHWSTDYLGRGIEHCQVKAYKGRNKRNSKFKIGDKVGVLDPYKAEVFLGKIIGLPPSIEDVYEFREQYRGQLKSIGARFSESEVLYSDNYPKEAYTVCINAEAEVDVLEIQTFLLIPLPNI
ncbi:MAG: hypothetical protein K2G47_04035 [Muribaculum sp.]|nr:hypothetical protein [Muribaculum sp.]